jgi:hypothetical protein
MEFTVCQESNLCGKWRDLSFLFYSLILLHYLRSSDICNAKLEVRCFAIFVSNCMNAEKKPRYVQINCKYSSDRGNKFLTLSCELGEHLWEAFHTDSFLCYVKAEMIPTKQNVQYVCLKS